MKRIAFFLLFAAFATATQAQNIQMHYDFGSAIYDGNLDSRPKITTTVEMFKPDLWGSTFFFIDMDYTNEGVYGGYFEIARELSFWDGPWSAHVEYNGGLVRGFSFQNSYLLGTTYTHNSKDFSKGFSLMALYKIIQKNEQPHSFQLTGTWYANFGKNHLLTFSGFADFWREKTPFGNFIFMTEPQLWLNLNKLKGVHEKFNLSLGTEVELTNNFGGYDGFHAIPTLALKWSFD